MLVNYEPLGEETFAELGNLWLIRRATELDYLKFITIDQCLKRKLPWFCVGRLKNDFK
jgi:hypothetical protein